MSIDIPAQRGGPSPLECPAWCRPDLCDIPTAGREIDHSTGPLWTRVLEQETNERGGYEPEFRLSLVVTRSDGRERLDEPVTIGPLRLCLLVELWNGHAWLPSRQRELDFELADADDLARNLGALVALCRISDGARIPAVAAQ